MYSIIKCTLNTTLSNRVQSFLNSCTLHGYKDGIYSPCVFALNVNYSPCVFALLLDKKKPTYIRMLQFLQSSCNERNFTLSTATVHTDRLTEVTMISAVHYIWPEAVVALSNFPLCQAWSIGSLLFAFPHGAQLGLSWGGITALSWGLLLGNGAQLGCCRREHPN